MTYRDVVTDDKDIAKEKEGSIKEKEDTVSDRGASPRTPSAASAETDQINLSGGETPLVSVATYATLDEARRAVERLAEAGFGRTEVSLHGTAFGSRTSEQHFWQGPLFRGSVAGLSAGAVVGLLFGFVGLSSVVSGVFYTVFSEMMLGAATGLIGFMAARARGGFQSNEDGLPRHFEVMVPATLAEKAAKVLAK